MQVEFRNNCNSLMNDNCQPFTTTKEINQKEIENFKKKLRRFCHNEKTEKIAEKLFEIVPKDLELHDLVDIIFKDTHRYDIPYFLKAILFKYPSFTLSPYDQIRKTILEDEKHLLTNSSLNAMLKEKGLDGDEEKIAACHDLAYRINHPYIYPIAQTAVPTSDYTLNFLWVNLNPQDRIQDVAQNIFKDGLNAFENAECIKDPNKLRELEKNESSLEKNELENWNQIKKTIGYRISKWADANPNATINFWYDSALVTQKAQQKTFEMMQAISQSRGVNLKLRDIRQLPSVKDEIENSLHPGTQVYFRVDLLKALIADYMITLPEEKYFVFSDIDVEPMTSQQLFDQRTLNYLSNNGYVFNRVGHSNFENSFFIFNREKEGLQKIHHKTLIKRTTLNIASLRQYPPNTTFKDEFILGSQYVFNQYYQFRQQMKDPYQELGIPRKIVVCPKSQFNFGGHFSDSDFQKETFRFIGSSNVPCTLYGRNNKKTKKYKEVPIKELKDWKAEPLKTP